MSIQQQFNEEQWFLLGATPGMIGAAMSNAAPSGVFGTLKEISATMQATIQGKKDFPDSELIQELMQKADSWDEAKEKMSDYQERMKTRLQTADIKDREALQALALKDCKAALELVDTHCSEPEATAYRQWMLNVAKQVAEAAKEGSILGIGGERVSAEERVFLSKLETELGFESGMMLA